MILRANQHQVCAKTDHIDVSLISGRCMLLQPIASFNNLTNTVHCSLSQFVGV